MRNRRYKGFALVLVASGVLSLVAPLQAQDPTAGLTGSVRDSSATPLAGALVHARHEATGLVYVTHTTKSGSYRLTGLPPGRYELRATRIGYGVVLAPGTPLRGGTLLGLHFVLPDEAVVLETLQVEQPLLETTSADISFTIGNALAERLPDASRRMTELALLAPGATSTSNGPAGNASNVALGGLNQNSTSVRLDGGTLNEPGVRNAFAIVPRLAVDQVQVLTTGYAAEFGQAAAGTISATTRRGSNAWSVEALVLARDRALSARDVFATEDPDFSRTLFGVAVGGPIQRDRTHLFVAVEAVDEQLAGILNTGGVHPQFDGAYDLPRDEQMVFARVDHRLDDDHEVMVRYSGGYRDEVDQIGPSWHCAVFGGPPRASPEFGVDAGSRVHSLLLRHRWEVGATSLNQASIHYFGMSDQTRRMSDEPALQFPALCDGGNFFDAEGDAHRLEMENAFSFQLGKSGRHGMKVGARLSLTGANRMERTFTNGRFILPADSSSEPVSFNQALTPLVNDERNTQIGLFVQDEWRPSTRLTLNLGLRYDIETNGTNQDFVGPGAGEVDIVSASSRKIDANNFAPRLGLAWDPAGDGRTVLRAGFGVFYDQHWLWRSAFESGLRGRRAQDPGTLDPDEVVAQEFRRIFPLDSVMPTPFSRQWSVGFERVLPADLVVRLDGLLVQGRNLPVTVNRASSHVVAPDPSAPPIFGITNYQNAGRAASRLLMLQLRKETDDLGFGLAYTLADRKTTVDSWLDFLGESAVADDFRDELAPTDWDERHRLTLSGWARLPVGLEGAMKLVYASARPYTVLDENGSRIGPRNGARGADFFTTDVSLGWPVELGKAKAGILLNIYNIFNRTNFDPTSYFGRMDSREFGQPTAAFPRRQLELGIQVRS